MIREMNVKDAPVVCVTCGTLVSNAEAVRHTKRHAKKSTPTCTSLTVKQLKEILNAIDENAELSLDVMGYEWDYAKLTVTLGDRAVTLMSL